MSTAIGPAFKLSSDVDVFDFSKQLRDTVVPVLSKTFFQDIHDSAVNQYDRSVENQVFKELIVKEIRENCICAPSDRSFFAKVALNLTGHLIKNPVRNEVYLLIPNAPDEVIKAILDLPEVEGEYSYYDSTDGQVEELGHDGWKDRLAAWREAMDFNQPISKTGVCVNLAVEGYKITWDEYQRHVPELTTLDDERRQTNIARSIYSRKVADKLPSGSRFNFIISLVSRSADTPPADWPKASQFGSELEESLTEAETVWAERKELA